MNDQRLQPAPPEAELGQEASRKRTEIEAMARVLTFEPGLYAIDFRAATGSMTDIGLTLPCARLEPVANPSGPGRAFVSMTPEGGWLSRATSTAHVLVVGGQAGAVLTVYRPTDGTPLPEVQFRSVLGAPATAQPPALGPQAGQPNRTEAGNTAMLTVHLEGVGDRIAASREWVGDIAGERCLEGFALSLPAGMPAFSLEYQGIMGEDWRTPWFEAGGFCGSRGLQLPLLGFCLRLVGDAAEQFDCHAYGHFARSGLVGPVGSGEDCAAEGNPLTAMRVEIVPKQDGAPALDDEAGPDSGKTLRLRRPKL